MNEYIKQAQDFCKKYNVIIEITYKCTDKYFVDDKEKRDIYNVTIIRKNKKYDFAFGDSIANTQKNSKKDNLKIKPSEYDILATLTKYDIGDFDDFCSEFGYEFKTEKEYIKIKQLYFDVKEEYKNVINLFNDCLDDLSEIQ